MAKLILTDNYNREYVADKLVEKDISDNDAKAKANEYNRMNPNSNWFAKAVPDDYKLWRGLEELI